jgi:glycosyl transferase family 25
MSVAIGASPQRLACFIINMDGAEARWRFVSEAFAATGIPFARVVGVNGRALSFPIPEFDEASYRWRHGKRGEPGQVGCYLSHLKALRTFLESDLEFAIVAEDDARPEPDLLATISEALRFRATWDLLRLCGFHDPHPLPFATLDDTRRTRLCIAFTRLCGTGAYLVNRRGAERMCSRLLPMRLPIDHAIDREWTMGISTAMLQPLPIGQVDHGFESQTGSTSAKLPALRRYWTVFPYRAVNETTRAFFRTGRWIAAALAARRVAGLAHRNATTRLLDR